jgi:type II secretory pathway component GspD/PulD (secretin)
VEKMPKFKGQLSIGIDELSNSLVVSAPAYLFDQVMKRVKELDEAAAPTSTVRVIRLGPGVSSQKTREVLSNILGEGSSGGKSSKTDDSAKSKSKNHKQSKNDNNKSSDESPLD